MNAARQKVEDEGCCRVCGLRAVFCDAAHTIDRSVSASGFTDPDLIVPLCNKVKGGAGCHQRYDAHALDLLPHLTLAEQVAMVREVGIERARNRAIGQQGVLK